MSNLYEVSGFYGSEHTPCTVLVYAQSNGSSWYCVEDSCNVSCTNVQLINGVDVELLPDYDTFTSNEAITTLDELEAFIDEEEEEEEEISRFDELTININEFGHQAMVDAPNEEVIRILNGIIKNIENYGLLNCDGQYLRDVNGNTVGNMSVDENPDY